MARRIRLVDIAERCGVSKAAVARAIGRPIERSELRPETYERIRREARAMGYRGLGRAAANGLVGLAHGAPAPSLAGPIGHAMAVLISALGDYGRDLVTLRGGEDGSWIDRMLQREVEGAIVGWPEPKDVMAAVERTGLPLVAVDACHELPLPRVLPDDVGNGRRLTRHLLELGHRRIAFVAPCQRGHPSSERRIAGWREAMDAAGVAGRLLQWGEARHVAELGALLRSRESPTAIVGYSDSVATAVLQLASSLGIVVPDRLSVIGCDASGAASWPPLTTLRLHTEHIGKAAAKLLVDLIESRSEPPTKPLLVAGTLQPGASTGGAPGERTRRKRKR
jgi:DNA-binding LacI/PurR family transcriptional regulator